MHLRRKKVWAANLSIVILLLTTMILRSPAVYAIPAGQAAEEKGTIIVGSQEALETQILAALSLNLLQDSGYEVAPITTENVGAPADLFWIETRISSTSFYQISGVFPVVGAETPEMTADIDGILQMVGANVDDNVMAELKALVENGPDGTANSGDEQAIEVVALEFLRLRGLIRPESKGQINIGSWEWTPPLIVTEITQQYLESAGYEVTFVQDEFVRDGVTNGAIDLYWDYTGSGITLWHGIPSRGVPQDPELVWEMIGELDGLHHDLTWLQYSSIDEAWVLMASHELYDNGMTTIEDLANYVRTNGDDSLVLCVEDDFYSSTTDGLPALFKFYEFELAESNINVVSYDELYEGMRAGECDVAEAFPDDGRLLVWDLPTLEDPRQFFVPFNLAPVVRNDTLAQYPELQGLLEQVSALIDTPTIQELSALVDIGPDGEPRTGDEQAIADVAQNYLKQVGLIPKPQLVVATGNKLEQVILGKMLVLLLEGANYPVVDMTGMEDDVSVRAAMDNGEVDVIIDFSSDALVNQHGLPLVALPEDAEKAHVLAASLDLRRDMVWLNRGALSDWSAVIARQELAQLGVTSIENLGRYITETADSLTLCTDGGFFGDEQSGLLAMQDRYGFTFDLDRVLLMEVDQVYEALRDGECTVGIGASTDGRIAAWGLVELTDPLNFFPYNTPAPVVRKAVLEENEELRTLLNGFMSALDENAMSKLTAQVLLGADDVEESGDEATPAEAAQGYLDSLAGQTDGEDSTATENNIATEENSPEEEAPPLDDESAPASDEQGADGETSASEAPATAGASDRIDQVNYDGAELLREALALVVELGRSGQLQSPQLIVGSKSSTEQMLLGKMMIVMLEDIGYRVEDKTGLGYSQLVRDALRSGEIDMYMELTGTALASYHNLPLSALPGDPEQSFNLARRMDEAQELVWLLPSRSNDTDTLIVRQDLADQNVRTIEDLANYVDANGAALTLCVEQEFAERQVKGLDDLLETYGLRFEPDNILLADFNETYAALRNDQCDVAQGLATDGRISAWGLVSLADTRQFFPAYTPAPIVRSDVLDANPGLAAYLGQLGEFVDDAAMRELNALIVLGEDGVQASGDEHDIREVATTFLCERRVITNCAASAAEAPSNETVPVEPVSAEPTAELQSDNAVTGDESNDESNIEESNRDAATSEQPNADESIAETAVVSDTLPAEDNTAAEPTPTVLITIPSAYGVNARQGPSTSSPVVQVLTRGSTVTAIGRLATSTWVQVSLAEDLTAWVFAGAVLYSPDDLETLPVSAP